MSIPDPVDLFRLDVTKIILVAKWKTCVATHGNSNTRQQYPWRADMPVHSFSQNISVRGGGGAVVGSTASKIKNMMCHKVKNFCFAHKIFSSIDNPGLTHPHLLFTLNILRA